MNDQVVELIGTVVAATMIQSKGKVWAKDRLYQKLLDNFENLTESLGVEVDVNVNRCIYLALHSVENAFFELKE